MSGEVIRVKGRFVMINVLHLGLSYKCNMRCKHCFVNRKKDVLEEKDYYHIIDSLFEQGLFVLYYTFGEPLMSEYFEKVSSYAKRKGLVQILMTNGSLINEEKIKIIKENKISKVCVSIDHIEPQKHDDNRNYCGSFDKAVNALQLLKSNGIKTEMSVTVTDNNVECLDEIYALGQSLHVDYISFLRERKDGKNIRLQYESKYFDFFKRRIMRKEQINVLFHDSNLLPIIRELYNKKNIDELTYERYYEMNCCHSMYTMSVEPNGNVLRCNLIHDVIGNIHTKSLKSILDEEGEKNEGISCCSSLS